MSKLKKHLSSILSRMDDEVDSWMIELRKRFGSDNPLEIVTYKSYGTPDQIYVRGRVLEEKGILKSAGKDSIWNNLLSMYKRFDSAEVPGATVQVTLNETTYEVTTDQ